MKNLLIALAAASLAVVGTTVASANTWKVVGYDTETVYFKANQFSDNTDAFVNIVYGEYDDQGLSTGRGLVGENQVAKIGMPALKEVTFTEPYNDFAYPGKEYRYIVIDGINTGVKYYTGVVAATRTVNYMWELAPRHRIFTVQQGLINGEWYCDATWVAATQDYSGHNAAVKADFNVHTGFGHWYVKDGAIAPLPVAFAPYLTVDDNLYVDGQAFELAPGAVINLTDSYAARFDAPLAAYPAVTGVKDSDVVRVKATSNVEVAGPLYNFDGTVTPGNEYALKYDALEVALEDEKSFPFKADGNKYWMQLKRGADANGNNVADYAELVPMTLTEKLANFGLDELVINTAVDHYVPTKWVDVGYEACAPYREYQYLEIDGILMNGRSVVDADGFTIRLPLVYRYTGARANPFARSNNAFVSYDYKADKTMIVNK